MRAITLIVVHCSATPETMDIGRDEIREWHKAKGWDDIGYHYVIRRDGVQEIGRLEQTVGAHAQGFNANSLGICLVGGTDANDHAKAEFNFTPEQMRSLERLVASLLDRFPKAELLGHRDLPNVHKACPCFSVKDWWANSSKGAIA